MNQSSRKFRRWVLAQIGVATMALAGWFLVRTSAYLRHPDDLDLYAHTWGFQFFMFAIFILPLFVGGMMIVLGTEWWVFRARRHGLDAASE